MAAKDDNNWRMNMICFCPVIRLPIYGVQFISEFLSHWLPYVSKGLCHHCSHSINHSVQYLLNQFEYASEQQHQQAKSHMPTPCHSHSKDDTYMIDTGSSNYGASGASGHIEETLGSERFQSPQRSWADMVIDQESEAEEEDEATENCRLQGKGEVKTSRKLELSTEERERLQFALVKRKKIYMCFERVNGIVMNIAEGLELHYNVFSKLDQNKIVDVVDKLQEMGKKGELKERTFTAPPEWLKGKGRVTLQFGCCYNFATDRDGNPPGILYNEQVDPTPDLFKVMIKRLVVWHVLPPTCVPDSCIVNIYHEGDCIPPHIDNQDFLRPICTVSFLSECNILFGSNLKTEGPEEFSGCFKIPLPVGSVLVLNGNGADVAQHCVPAVPTKRKMKESKWPDGFHPQLDLQGLEPLIYKPDTNKRVLARDGLSLKDHLPGESFTLAEALMAPTVIYVKQITSLVFFLEALALLFIQNLVLGLKKQQLGY